MIQDIKRNEFRIKNHDSRIKNHDSRIKNNYFRINSIKNLDFRLKVLRSRFQDKEP